MCMWQSAALAGAFTLAGLVPVVFGTGCWARTAVASSVPAMAAAAAAVKKVRRPIDWALIDFPPVVLLPGPTSVLESDCPDRSNGARAKIGRLAPVQSQTDPLCRRTSPSLPSPAGGGG